MRKLCVVAVVVVTSSYSLLARADCVDYCPFLASEPTLSEQAPACLTVETIADNCRGLRLTNGCDDDLWLSLSEDPPEPLGVGESLIAPILAPLEGANETTFSVGLEDPAVVTISYQGVANPSEPGDCDDTVEPESEGCSVGPPMNESWALPLLGVLLAVFLRRRRQPGAARSNGGDARTKPCLSSP